MKRRPRKRLRGKRRARNKPMLAQINKNLNKYLPKGKGMIEKAMRYSVMSGGKRIRPIIAIEAFKACGAFRPSALLGTSPELVEGRPSGRSSDGGGIKDIMPIACAIEFIHTYSLIHDDLPAMDNDDFRRGKPACHKVFGPANAILAGDALLTLAFNTIAKDANPKIALNIIKELSDAIGIYGMVGGQALDLESRDKAKDKNISNKINLLKTAKLLEVSAKSGALAAGAPQKEMRALQKFGLYLGLSFQLVDDYLDGEIKFRKDRVLEDAAPLIEKAKKELEIFGKRADSLKNIADRLLKRTK